MSGESLFTAATSEKRKKMGIIIKNNHKTRIQNQCARYTFLNRISWLLLLQRKTTTKITRKRWEQLLDIVNRNSLVELKGNLLLAVPLSVSSVCCQIGWYHIPICYKGYHHQHLHTKSESCISKLSCGHLSSLIRKYWNPGILEERVDLVCPACFSL